MSDTVICHNVDHHDDMYPEFAPEPIVVACRKPAVALFVWDYEDPEGPTTDVLCSEHTFERMTWALEGGRRFVARALLAEDRDEYLAGRSHALAAEVTDGQFRTATLAPELGEAGLWTPDNTSELFDVGWAWAMTERVGEWAERDSREFEQGWERDA
jgi:hypothetical protein